MAARSHEFGVSLLILNLGVSDERFQMQDDKLHWCYR